MAEILNKHTPMKKEKVECCITLRGTSNMKQKIVVAHLYNNFTGSPKVLSDVIAALNQAGHPVDLYTNEGPGFLDETLADWRYYVWYKWQPNKYLRLINFICSQILLFFRLLKYQNEDVTIYANTILPFGAGLAGWVMQKRVIYHVHETEFQPRIFTRFLLAIIRLSAHKLIFVSKYLQDYHHFPHIPQEVVYNALPQEFLDEVAEHETEEKKEDFEVLMMCSLKKAKGIFEYIELAEKLPDLTFTLIISQSMDQIMSFLEGKELPDNLELKPVQQNVHPFYAQADLLLSLSHPIEWPETFGMTLLEGMCYGLPSIVPTVGAPLELVQEGKEGFHMDMRELDKISAKIWDLYQDEQQRAALSNQARLRSQDFRMEIFEQEITKAVQVA